MTERGYDGYVIAKKRRMDRPKMEATHQMNRQPCLRCEHRPVAGLLDGLCMVCAETECRRKEEQERGKGKEKDNGSFDSDKM